MKVRFKRSHPAYGYFAGDEAVLDNPVDLLNAGFVEAIAETAEQAIVPKAETAQKKSKKK